MDNQTYSNWEQKTTNEIFYFCSIVMVPIGLCFNLVEFLVFRSKDFEKANFGFLMNMSILVNSFSLFWSVIVFKLLPSINIQIDSFSSVTCSLYQYFSRIVQQIPLYIQAFISFINYLSVAHPARFISINKKSYFILIFFSILIGLSVINLPSSIKYLTPVANSTSQSCTASNTIFIVSTLIHIILRCVIPFLIISLNNYFTVSALIRPRNLLNFPTDNERKFGKVCLILGFVFLLFNFPLFCIQMTLVVVQYFKDYSADSLKMITFVFNCSRVLAWSYYALGLFINVSVNELFRKNLLKLFKKFC